MKWARSTVVVSIPRLVDTRSAAPISCVLNEAFLRLPEISATLGARNTREDILDSALGKVAKCF